jgi:hypothetical protein
MGDAPLFRGPETALRELGALELVYLFPVAGRFRSGSYDGQIQYRLNGWGRALATRLTAARPGQRKPAPTSRNSTHTLPVNWR